MVATVLLADDEETLRVLVQAALEPHGFRVLLASNGTEAFRSYFREKPDLVLLDVMMPGMNGWQVLERIREVGDTPVLMLTALGQVDDKVKGLSSGADDYVVKPFSPEELVARCRAVLRRAPPDIVKQAPVYEDEALKIDFASCRISIKGKQVNLAPTEFSILSVLTRNAGAVVMHDRLIEEVWGAGAGSRDVLRLYIRYLRLKLGDDARDPRLIQSVRGFGYLYSPP